MTLRELVLREPTGTKFKRKIFGPMTFVYYDPILNMWFNTDSVPILMSGANVNADDWEVFEDNSWKPIQEFDAGVVFEIFRWSDTIYKWKKDTEGKSLWYKGKYSSAEWQQCYYHSIFTEANGRLYK